MERVHIYGLTEREQKRIEGIFEQGGFSDLVSCVTEDILHKDVIHMTIKDCPMDVTITKSGIKFNGIFVDLSEVHYIEFDY